MVSDTNPKKVAVHLLRLVPGLVSVATNAGYTSPDPWAASSAYSIKACLCALTASPLELHKFLALGSLKVNWDCAASFFVGPFQVPIHSLNEQRRHHKDFWRWSQIQRLFLPLFSLTGFFSIGIRLKSGFPVKRHGA
jgi:hypothetical protein